MKRARIIVNNPDELKNRFELEKNPSVKIKLLFLNFVAQSAFDFEKMCKLCGVAISTGYQLVRDWNETGYESVKEKDNKGGRPPKLSEEDLHKLKSYLEEKESWKTKEVKNLINERFGVDLSEDQVARILNQKLRVHISKNTQGDAIIINDLNDIITAWSPGAEKMFGWKAQEAIGKKALELIVPQDVSLERDLIIGTALKGRSITGIDTVRLYRDGTRINVSISVFPLRDTKQNIIGISYILRDITARKRAEEVLQREHDQLNIWVQELTSELSNVSKNLQAEIIGHKQANETVETTLKLWQDTFNAISDGVWILDREGHIILSNGVYERLLGINIEDVTGMHCHKIAHCSFGLNEECPLKRMLKTGTREYAECEDKGLDRWFQITVDPICNRSGEIISAVHIKSDITERKRAEEALLRMREELEIRVKERTAELARTNEALKTEIKERKEIEGTLRRSEEKFRNIVEQSVDGIVVTDEQGTIIEWNRGEERIIGVSRADTVGRPIWDIQFQMAPEEKKNPEQYERLKANMLELIKTGKSHLLNRLAETDIQFPDGMRRSVQVQVFPIKTDRGFMLGSISRDITERKRAEQERERLLNDISNQQQHAEKLANLLKKERDTLNIIMEYTETQLAYLDSRFNFIRVNSAYAKGSGFTRDGLLGSNLFQLFPNLENQGIFEKVRDTGEPVEFKAKPYEFQDQPWRGTTYLDWTLTPVKDQGGRIDRLVLSLTDVTERIRAEKAIEKALAYSESIVDTVPEPLLIVDKNLKVKMANRAFYQNFRVSIEDTREKSLFELGNGQWDIPELRMLLEDIIMKNNRIQNFEVDHDFPNIGRKTMLLNAREFYQDGAEMVLLSIEDITERKKIEEIRLENERLIFANKARSEFLAIMSHELRTPLTSIIGYSIILNEKTQGELNEKQDFYVQSVLKSSEHLLSLINSILDMAKIEAGKLEMIIEDVSVPDMINETFYLMKEIAANHNIVLENELDPALEIIKADRQKLKQILFNLLSNAVKFSKENGGIITMRTRRDGNVARISISDTGIGIMDEDIPRLFHKFEQLDSGISRKYEGTGLGLAITKQLVELHGGKIWVESRYGEGSTFLFTIPITGIY